MKTDVSAQICIVEPAKKIIDKNLLVNKRVGKRKSVPKTSLDPVFSTSSFFAQRCVIHVQRMLRIWLSSKPKSLAGQELRRIVSTLHLIKTKTELSYWLLELAQWDQKHHNYTHEKTINPDTGKYW